MTSNKQEEEEEDAMLQDVSMLAPVASTSPQKSYPKAESFDVVLSAPEPKRVLFNPLSPAAKKSSKLHPCCTLIQHVTDMSTYPKFEHMTPASDKPDDVIIGDLHGNSLKLLYAMLVEGMVDLVDCDANSVTQGEMARKHEIYAKLRELICMENPTSNDLIEFRRMVDVHVNVNQECDRMIHFLGDEFSDRGQNDYFTIVLLAKLLGKLSEMVEILLSNHGVIFYKYAVGWMLEQDGKAEGVTEGVIQSISNNALEPSTISLHRFHRSLATLPAEELQLLKRNMRTIISVLTPVSYLETESHDYVVLTHAPANIASIKRLVVACGVKSDANAVVVDTANDLMDRIDEVCKRFTEKFVNNGTFFLHTEAREENSSKRVSPIEIIFARVLYPRLEDENDNGEKVLEMGKVQGLIFVHGHDGRFTRETQYGYCMDNTLGKESAVTYADRYSTLHVRIHIEL